MMKKLFYALLSMAPGAAFAAMGGQGTLSFSPPSALDALEAACTGRGKPTLDRKSCRLTDGRTLVFWRSASFSVDGIGWHAVFLASGDALSVATWSRDGAGWKPWSRQDDFTTVGTDVASAAGEITVQPLDDGEAIATLRGASDPESGQGVVWRFLKFSPAQRQWSYGGSLSAKRPAAPGADSDEQAEPVAEAAIFDPGVRAGAWPALHLSFGTPGLDQFFEFDARAGAYASVGKPPVAGGRARIFAPGAAADHQ